MIVGIVVGVGVAGLLALLLMFFIVRQRRKAQAAREEGKLIIANLKVQDIGKCRVMFHDDIHRPVTTIQVVSCVPFK